ncbi:hypothetical protein PV341_43310 [Streptomyces sp. PA03-1a]|nr:hypothetical protein [Streptomyces sp. PA03-1a]MDX2813397.1 hypothetical protein [Streptomyces sp. PA03-5A]
MATYVVEAKPGLPFGIPGATTLRKYIDWDPSGGGAAGPLFDTGYVAPIPDLASVFSGGSGILYQIDRKTGQLKSYKDNTASGGSLMTYVKTFKSNSAQPWASYDHVWSVGSKIFTIDDAGTLAVHQPSSSDAPDGQGVMLDMATISATNAAVIAINKSDEVWSAGNKIYGLTDGTIRSWTLSWLGVIPKLDVATETVLATDTKVTSAWSPGPGTVYTATTGIDYSGIVKGYTGAGGTALTLANDDVRQGLYARSVFTDTASCLAATPDTRPYFGAQPDESGLTDVGTDSPPDSTPTNPSLVQGKFTLGNGQPAAGLEVTVEAADLVADDGTATDLPDLGKVHTAADGTWKLTLPNPLPAAIQAAADANDGALNLTATTAGVTTSGVNMFGADNLVAAPEVPGSTQPTGFALSASNEAPHTTALSPLLSDTDPNNAGTDPTPEQVSTTFAATAEQYSVEPIDQGTTPTWQSDRSAAPPAGFNPYVVNGVDTSGQAVTPLNSGSCEWLTQTLSKTVAYTTVGEAHAYWDAKANFDYDQKLSSTVDVATSHNDTWKITGTVSVGGSTGISTGYSNKGPYFAKQWRVPIEYKKIKKTYYCSGVARSSYRQIVAGKYKVPAGGSTGKYGQDVRSKDGPTAFQASPRQYYGKVPGGSYFQLSSGKSTKWTKAVAAFGISLSAATSYDREHKQRITAGNKTGSHIIWGKNGPLSSKPGVFYSY